MLVETPELDKIERFKWLKIVQYNTIQQVEIDSLLNNHIWITAKRIQIHVNKMTTNHINNCIKCFNGQGNMTIPNDYLGGRDKWLKIFREELLKRQ